MPVISEKTNVVSALASAACDGDAKRRCNDIVRAIMRDRRLSAGCARSVELWAGAMAGGLTKWWRKSIAWLAHVAGKGRTQTKSYLNELREFGYLQWKAGFVDGVQIPNLYRLVMPGEPVASADETVSSGRATFDFWGVLEKGRAAVMRLHMWSQGRQADAPINKITDTLLRDFSRGRTSQESLAAFEARRAALPSGMKC